MPGRASESSKERRADSRGPADGARSQLLRRLAWLCACASVGVAAAVVGRHYTGHEAWLLAVPLAIAAGWLVVADPTQCEPRGRAPSRLAKGPEANAECGERTDDPALRSTDRPSG